MDENWGYPYVRKPSYVSNLRLNHETREFHGNSRQEQSDLFFFFKGQIAGNLTMKHGDLEIQSSHVCGG